MLPLIEGSIKNDPSILLVSDGEKSDQSSQILRIYYEYIIVYLFTIIRGSSWYSIIIILKMLHNIL